jgi:carbon monoxide dehydrogenase subunit G
VSEPSAAPEPAAPPSRAPVAEYRFSFPLKVLASASALLIVALVVGLLLPGRWEVERSVLVAAPPEAVFSWLDDPHRWDAWAPMGDVESSFSGPERGSGATRSWDDPEMGDGRFTILATQADREVQYRVEVQGGSLITQGTLRLVPEGTGTRVTWAEVGDFGPNPLLGYTALGMDRMQGNQMDNALRRLADLAESEAPDAPDAPAAPSAEDAPPARR